VCEAFEQLSRRDPVDLLTLDELDRQPVRIAALHRVERFDRLEEEALAALPVAQALETRAAEDRAPRREPLPDRFHRRPRPERESAKIEVGESKVPNKLAHIPGEDAARIILRAVRLAAEPVRTKIRHDHAKAGRRDPL